MEKEMYNFLKVWLLAIISICYCYYLVSRFPRGFLRLLSTLPIISLFLILPFDLSSFHLGGPTVFYLVWLSNFKLLLFSFNKPPLSSHTPPLSLLHFTSIALLPIKTKQSLTTPPHDTTKFHGHVLLTTKILILAIIVYLYNYRNHLHPYIILGLYCCHVYLGVELVLAITGLPVRALLGLDLEPQFNEPYLATSLQDFWGRRWNLMVTSVLRPTVYYPVRSIFEVRLGLTWAPAVAIFATFLVPGLMHEVIYFYLTRVSPTWEVTWFFVLHGVCTATEVAVKKAVGKRWRLHEAVSGMLTLGFVAVTGAWLFFPQVVRNGVEQKAIGEYAILVKFVRDNIMLLLEFMGLLTSQ